MRIVTLKILQRRPRVYGLVYLSLIPIYAGVYYVFPSIIGSERSFIECLYFSIVTITTLGYGDITPVDETGQLVTVSESLFGVVSIGLFLNAVASARSDRIREEQAKLDAANYKETQRAKLNGHYGLVSPVIERYRAAVLNITSRTQDNGRMKYNPNFELKDLKHLYKPTILIRDHHLRPAVFGYFEALDLLHKELSDLIKNVDLRCFPAVEPHILELVGAIKNFDHSGPILSAPGMKVGDRTMTEFAEEMMEHYQGDYVPHGSNLIDSYLALYHQIKIIMLVSVRMDDEVQQELGRGD